jgi:hypothetical protein
MQTPSAPWIFCLLPPLGTLCPVQRLAESIHLCICQTLIDLSGDSYIRILSESTSLHRQCLGLVTIGGMDPHVRQSLDGHSSVSASHFVSVPPSIIFVPHSKDQSFYTLVSFFLSFMCFANCILDILRF